MQDNKHDSVLMAIVVIGVLSLMLYTYIISAPSPNF
jgi:hypothetical protein